MTAYKPLPYELRKPIVSYLRKTNQTIEFLHIPHLVPGRLNVDDIDRAWYAGAIAVDESGNIAICGISVRAFIDTKKLRNRLVEHLCKAKPAEIVDAAAFFGVGL